MRPPISNFTFLFTDIEGSTQLWERYPEAMGKALAQHDNLIRSVVEKHQGYVFKTVGDAFCVVFESALDAVHAAVESQRELAAALWNETGPLRVRMALHSGEAEQRLGDYFGQTLNRVARLLASGHGGQTLLSQVTVERVREALPQEIGLRDLGERRLKDLNRPERIFQVQTPDLPHDFPPLRSLEVLPNNLPSSVTTFVGRVREIGEVKGLLRTTRLLTLTGPGGTGKTRLSLQVAGDVLEQFPHGVWLVELATVSDGALVPETIANSAGLREEWNRSPLETLVKAWRARHLLLILDNCEHLITACAQTVASLLRDCPEVRILASSRESLNIEGEAIWVVPPLSVVEFRPYESDLDLNHLMELEAVQLFRDRATATSPHFKLTAQNALLVAKICWRLDGLPLAIELAAARVKVLSLDQILARLDDRFRLLNSGSRNALPRQKTLGALIDWSYDLLSEPERILLRRLTVFVAGRTLEMAEEVCAGEGIEKNEILNFLSALVEKSLLMIEPGFDGENRYTMLESVWDYAEEKLQQSQETARFRRKHLDYFVRFAEAAEPFLFGADQMAWLEKLSFEHYNLHTALRFSKESSETLGSGLRLAGALTRYWEVRSFLTEGYELFQQLMEPDDPNQAPAVRAKAEFGAGRLSWCQDRDHDARRHYQRALILYQNLGMIEQVGLIEAHLGFTERNDGNNPAAHAHFNRAKIIAEAQRSERVMALVLNGLGSLAADEGDFANARQAKERSLTFFRTLGDLWAVALVTASLGRMCLMEGDLATARQLIRESLTFGRDLANKGMVPYAIEALANIFAEENQAPKAVRLYGAASAQREALALSFSSTERVIYDRAVGRLREMVSNEVFEKEWDQGRSLGFHSAIDLAMDIEVSPSSALPLS